MELRITQCSTGRFNLLSSEESFSFYMGICENDKIIEKDGAKAQLHFSGDASEGWGWNETFENLEDIFIKCFAYAHKIYSTTNYKANCLLFAEVYQANYEEINSNILQKRNEKIVKQIEQLQKQLTEGSAVPDLSDSINYAIGNEMQSIRQTIEWSEKKMAELKEDSDTYKDYQKRIEKCNAYKETLALHLTEAQ